MKTTKEILNGFVINDNYKDVKWFSEEEIRKEVENLNNQDVESVYCDYVSIPLLLKNLFGDE